MPTALGRKCRQELIGGEWGHGGHLKVLLDVGQRAHAHQSDADVRCRADELDGPLSVGGKAGKNVAYTRRQAGGELSLEQARAGDSGQTKAPGGLHKRGSAAPDLLSFFKEGLGHSEVVGKLDSPKVVVFSADISGGGHHILEAQVLGGPRLQPKSGPRGRAVAAYLPGRDRLLQGGEGSPKALLVGFTVDDRELGLRVVDVVKVDALELHILQASLNLVGQVAGRHNVTAGHQVGLLTQAGLYEGLEEVGPRIGGWGAVEGDKPSLGGHHHLLA